MASAVLTSGADGTRRSFLSRLKRKVGRSYLEFLKRTWNRLTPKSRESALGLTFGRHVNAVERVFADRRQAFATFFLRNRAELSAVCRLVEGRQPGSTLRVTVFACSKGAEVYSILWALRSRRPDLNVVVAAIDISGEIVEFAKQGVYSRLSVATPSIAGPA